MEGRYLALRFFEPHAEFCSKKWSLWSRVITVTLVNGDRRSDQIAERAAVQREAVHVIATIRRCKVGKWALRFSVCGAEELHARHVHVRVERLAVLFRA